MKKFTFLVAAFLISATAAKASVIESADAGIENRFGQNEPIEFTERGISFFVFPNGEFDFNTRPNNNQGDYYYRTANRNRNFNPNRAAENYGVLIENDNFGRIRRVGNTFINYDFNNRVTRIGSVFMRYNRFALVQIGGMQLIYNRFGTVVDSYGSVKGFRNQGFTNSYYGTRGSCETGYSNNFRDDDEQDLNFGTDNDSYYYRADGTKVKNEGDKKEIKVEKSPDNNGRR